ncbi:dihydrofolate reductase family protein [Nisaea sediminum]|uniref:dihydrofolate reductase family protein n=1 Tax=Nisaea sediminum TaxID=2775867 RepID=UPI0029C0BD92|nr:dihydrofolate reductase family protein [Nisaea sediminum]
MTAGSSTAAGSGRIRIRPGDLVVSTHSEPFDLLLGRHTYDIWSGYWPTAEAGPIADSINGATKYVATRRPDSLDWEPVESLGADIAEGVRRLKATDGPDLILWGSSSLTPLLLGEGLADEVTLFVYPVLLGTGKRFFSDAAGPQTLSLISSTATASGTLINHFTRGAPFRTGDFRDDRT